MSINEFNDALSKTWPKEEDGDLIGRKRPIGATKISMLNLSKSSNETSTMMLMKKKDTIIENMIAL